MCLDTVGRILVTDNGMAEVQFDGARRAISLVLLQADDIAVEVGDWLLTHTGLAVERLDPAMAQRMVAEAKAIRNSEVVP